MNTDSKGSIKSVFSNLAKQFSANIQTYAIIVALLGIWAFFYMMRPSYLSPRNFSNLFRQMAITSFLAAGMVLVIVTGNIDLSVGKLAGFVSVVVAKFQDDIWTSIPWEELPFGEQPVVLTTVISVLIGLATGTLIGMLQGYIISYWRIPSFIVTLAGMWMLDGAILLVTEGKTIAADQPTLAVIAQRNLDNRIGWIIAALVVVLLFFSMFNSRRKKRRYGFELAPLYLDLLRTVLFAGLVGGYIYMVNQYEGLQVLVLLLAIAAVTVTYVSNNTRFGRYAYAIGGNIEAARLSGVNIRKNVFGVFTLMGFLCGIGGVALASYVGYGTIAAGQGYELDAIASCILGGTSTLGGVGTIFGAMVGSLIMTSLGTGLQILNVQAAWQKLVKGIVLVLAVYVDVFFKTNSVSLKDLGGLYFSFKGRIGRRAFWLRGLVPIIVLTAGVIGVIVLVLVEGQPAAWLRPVLVGLGILWMLLVTWASLSVQIKRLHDRDKSGWWILIDLVPIIGQIWSLVELGCLKGTEGPNRFGEEPS